MSEAQQEQSKAPRGRRVLIAAAAAAVLLGVGVGVLYAHRQQSHTTAADGGAPASGAVARYAKGSLAKLTAAAPGAVTPEVTFQDANGKPTTLAAFRGKVVVLNLWATWCTPCLTEMPTLAALQRRYAGTDLVVKPVSVDRESDIPDARDFIGVNEPLELYNDPKFALPAALKVQGMPATVIYDRQGREVARLMGEADWNSPEAAAFFDHLLKR